MRKLKIASILLLIISTAIFLIFQIYMRIIKDDKSPVVTCKTEEITVDVSAEEEELLKGVSANDTRSGDVSDTLVVESLSDFAEDGSRVATYAAVDESKNVGRATRIVRYNNYEAPTFDLKAPLCFRMGTDVDLLGNISAESSLDGDLSKKIKYSMEESIDSTNPGKYPVSYRVLDSAGNTVYLDTYVEIYDNEYAGIEVELKEYLVYVKKGTSFKADQYFGSMNVNGVLSIKSEVDTSVPGTYNVDYIVKGDNVKGKSSLVVVVME